MLSKVLLLLLVFSSACMASLAQASPLSAGSSAFVENRGQWDSRALFLSQMGGLNLWITQEGPVLEFNKFVQTGPARNGPSRFRSPAGYVVGQVVKMSFVAAQPTAVSGQSEGQAKYNYLIGNNEHKWVQGARTFSEALAAQPYKGISVRYSIDQGTPRYDVVVGPGADPSQVGMKIEGADSLKLLADGNLQLATSLGTVEERGLIAYQDTASGRAQIPCRMVLDGNVLKFDLGGYDVDKTLIIDPLVASTFLGGALDCFPYGVAKDGSSNIYVAGTTSSTNFPPTTGAFQKTNNTSSDFTGFVAKLNSTETTLSYFTYLGGTGSDQINCLAVDSAGDAYVAGYTTSIDFPCHPAPSGAYQEINNSGGLGTGFVTKINPAGSALLYSTYLGGSGGDAINCIAIDSLGDATVGGQTSSIDFPSSAGAYQTVNKAGPAGTGFVTRLNPTGTNLVYSTYLGGTGTEGVQGLALDANKNAFVAGYTCSSNFPVSSLAYQKSNKTGGNATGFLTSINPGGTKIGYSTYLGGTGADYINCLALDAADHVTVAGKTYSTDFPTTAGVFQLTNKVLVKGTGFVATMAPNGASLVYSTYLGGSGGESINAVALDSSLNASVAGETFSSDFPTTTPTIQSTNLAGSLGTGFVTKMNPTGKALVFSSYLGGSGSNGIGDSCSSLFLSGTSAAIVAGYTSSANFPVSANAYDMTNSSGNPTGFVSNIPYWVVMLALTQYSVTGGNEVHGAVSVPTPAGSSGDVVTIAKSSNLVTVQTSVRIVGGATSNSFPITTRAVTVVTHVTITVTYNGVSTSQVLTLNP